MALCWRPRLIGYRVPHEVLGWLASMKTASNPLDRQQSRRCVTRGVDSSRSELRGWEDVGRAWRERDRPGRERERGRLMLC